MIFLKVIFNFDILPTLCVLIGTVAHFSYRAHLDDSVVRGPPIDIFCKEKLLGLPPRLECAHPWAPSFSPTTGSWSQRVAKVGASFLNGPLRVDQRWGIVRSAKRCRHCILGSLFCLFEDRIPDLTRNPCFQQQWTVQGSLHTEHCVKFWDSSFEQAEYIKPKIQRWHLFADLTIPHLWGRL